MSWSEKVSRVISPFTSIMRTPHQSARQLLRLPDAIRAHEYVAEWRNGAASGSSILPTRGNPLRDYFERNQTGPGIWKWEQYFDMYHRHLLPFVGTPVRLVEVGIYSGGSLGMWRSYFGEQSHIIGVDIEPACRAYEREGISVAIGDQADRSFWRRFRDEFGPVDVVIDDGGHTPEQQRITLEEMLPFLRAGGVYICEDVEGVWQPFGAYALELAGQLNAWRNLPPNEKQALHCSGVSPFQADIHSVHFYPFAVAIEKNQVPIDRLSCPKRGSEWQPFFDRL